MHTHRNVKQKICTVRKNVEQKNKKASAHTLSRSKHISYYFVDMFMKVSVVSINLCQMAHREKLTTRWCVTMAAHFI